MADQAAGTNGEALLVASDIGGTFTDTVTIQGGGHGSPLQGAESPTTRPPG